MGTKRRPVAGGILALAATAAVGSVGTVVGGSTAPEWIAWTRGARLVADPPGVRQRRANDCGPAALAQVLRSLGFEVSYPDPSSTVRIGPRGCRLEELATEARRLGAVAEVRRLDPEDVDRVRTPAILHLKAGHFVVLEGRVAPGAGRAECGFRIHDPSLGALEQSAAGVARQWSGWALEIHLPERRSL